MHIGLPRANLAFGKALPTSKKEDYKNTVESAKKALGLEGGLSLLKIDSNAIPEDESHDTGIGKLNTDTAADFIDYMAFYTGANAVKIFPFGQYTKTDSNFYCPYLKTATTIGEETINLFHLVESKTYGNLLDKSDAEAFVKSNKTSPDKINFENELGESEKYPILIPLKKAYDNFKAGKSPKALEKEFEEYKNSPFVDEYYTRLALYPVIGKKEPDLFKGIDKNPLKQRKFEKYKKENAEEIEFFKFRQFIAQKEHNEAKEKINKNGQKLFGDCLIGFSNQEIWAHPDAFIPKTSIGLYDWGLPALNFDEILIDNSPANKVFKDKISFFLKNFDGIRFDVGWCYAIARTENTDHIEKQYDLKNDLFNLIKQTAYEVKGADYDTNNLIYEMDGFEAMFDWKSSPPVPLANIRNNVSVLTTEWQHSNNDGWGHPGFLVKTGLTQDEFIMGTNNHDGKNLRQLAESNEPDSVKKRKDSAQILSRTLDIPYKQILDDGKEFVKAKFAQLFCAKNQFLFFIDVLGSDVDEDNQHKDSNNYRFRLDRDYERQYHNALQSGNGFNLPESLAIVMKSKGLDKTNKELYEKVSYYADYLRQKGPKTQREADFEERKMNLFG